MKVGKTGRLIGAVSVCAAIVAVFVIKVEKKPVEESTAVRPIKSFVVGSEHQEPKLYFPGTVDAESSVSLSFEVGGRLVELPLKRGQKVEEGEVLARLDARDFENQVKNAQAELDLAASTLARVEKALELNAVSQEDLSRARADRDKAQAQLDIRQKALDDTALRARFGGLVSDIYVDNFDTVSAGQAILKLQNVGVLTLEVAVPETYVLQSTEQKRKSRTFSAVFDALPGRVFAVTPKEFATLADPVTQTYRATFLLESAADVLLLPGMNGTVVADLPEGGRLTAAVQVPSDAVGIDSNGGFFVWVLEANGDGTYTVRQRTVAGGERAGQWLGIESGLATGDRIAAAGITVLTDGRVVSLLEDDAAAWQPPQEADGAVDGVEAAP